MSIKIDTKALDDFAKKLQKASETKSQEICEEALNEISASVLSRAIKQSPRDTGKLARSWKVSNGVQQKGKGFEKTVYNTTDYSVYVEFGHRTRDHRGWVPGQFMLTRALEDVDKMKDSILMNVVNKHLGDIFS